MIRVFHNISMNFRPESSFRQASLGHSPSLNIPISSPADVTLTENEKYTMYTLKQLKRTPYFLINYYFNQNYNNILIKFILNRLQICQN